MFLLFALSILHKNLIMLTNIHSAKCIGINAITVTVEIDITSGIGIHLVGLADAAVKESLLRTITALQSLGFRIPGKKIVINLAPADLHKSGSGYDLPIALGIISASGQKEMPGLNSYLIMGELGLNGAVREINGALPIAELAEKKGLKGCILPKKSAIETIEYCKSEIYGIETLGEAIAILEGKEDCKHLLIRKDALNGTFYKHSETIDEGIMDFADIVGQEGAKRGIEIAAAGGHNVIMIGAPGSGKSSIAKAIAGILPPMTREEAIVTSKIYSVSGKGDLNNGLIRKRPFRAPHYSASLSAIIGGGCGENIIPGEISLAQNGVLFIDEYCQAPKSILEALRGPIEDRKVTISRLRSKVEYPASFMLIAATNPCPCGYYGEGNRCTCTVAQRTAYLARLSGPIIDRIDIQLWLHPVQTKKLINRKKEETSAEVAARVLKTREIQKERFKNEGIFTNSEMSEKQTSKYCPLSKECRDLMEKLILKGGFSARAYSRIMKLARTIADLDDSMHIKPQHISEAAGYRFLDKQELNI